MADLEDPDFCDKAADVCGVRIQRHETACLFAALDVHSGGIVHDTKARNRSEEFIEFIPGASSCITPRRTRRG